MGKQTMTTSDLRLSDIPQKDAAWDEIAKFALTFNAYEVFGSFEACAEIANARRGNTMNELRCCLFFEQRRWRHFGEEPNAATLDYVRQVIEQIRERAALGQPE